MALTNEQLLAEIEELIRSMPALGNLMAGDLETSPWLGRAAAVLKNVDFGFSLRFPGLQSELLSGLQGTYPKAAAKLLSLLHEARYNVVLRIPGPRSAAIASGGVFSYFDEIRKIVETATSDILFIDPYLDVEFASRFLAPISSEVTVRLLTKDNKFMSQLLPAVKLLSQQNSISIRVRKTQDIHDRYVLVDGLTCYQSGASFKDGAKNAPVTITQIIDAFPAVKQTYEALWNSALDVA